MNDNNKTLGWGKTDESGVEIWDDNPVFQKDAVDYKDRLKLLFYPKKFLLYRYIAKAKKRTKVDLKEPYRVLDVGCARGYIGSKIKSMGNFVVGIDISQSAAEKAKEVLDEVYVCDLEKDCPEFSEKFDLAILPEVLEHVFDPVEVLKKISSNLNDGGEIIAALHAKGKAVRANKQPVPGHQHQEKN